MPTCLYKQPLPRLHGSEADSAAGWELFSITSGRRQEERRREETIIEESSTAEDLMLARTLCTVPIWNWCPTAAVEPSWASAHTHTPSHCCCFLPPLLCVSSHKRTGSVLSCSSNWYWSHLRWRRKTWRLDSNRRWRGVGAEDAGEMFLTSSRIKKRFHAWLNVPRATPSFCSITASVYWILRNIRLEYNPMGFSVAVLEHRFDTWIIFLSQLISVYFSCSLVSGNLLCSLYICL